MSITDELREWARGFENVWVKPASKEIVVTTGTSMPVDHVNMRLFIEGMLDRVDAEHEKAEQDLIDANNQMEQLCECSIRLPVDADGVPIHVGDVLTDGEYTFRVDELAAFGDGSWSIRNDDGNAWAACDVTHRHAPTVEDVLREFAEGLGVPVADSYVAATAAKLRLRGDGE